MLILIAITFAFHIIFSLNMSIFDMNPVTFTIFVYFAIFLLDLKKYTDISNAKIIIIN